MAILDAVVVGAGIVGATVAKALRSTGREVTVYDDRRGMSGTFPSGGHLRHAWFKDIPEDQQKPALKLLDECWGLHNEKYWFCGKGVTNERWEQMYRVDVDEVLSFKATNRTVKSIGMLQNMPLVSFDKSDPVRCRLLVVCNGHWAGKLLSGVDVTPKQGVSFRVLGKLKKRIISQWAPYKQVVAHQQAHDRFWIGDGTAIIDRNWGKERQDESMHRCLQAVGVSYAKNNLEVRLGIRPYCTPDNPTDPCLLRRIGPRAWLATGAGKNGTIAAGWAAWRILQELGS